MVYHRVGCVACHGALQGDLAAADPAILQIAGKTSISPLAAFLKDPLRDHPAGRMPSLLLDDLEAKALATYLVGLSTKHLGTPEAEASRASDRRRGAAAFASRGCNRHETGPAAN
jgi:mono/diheme cytochrome c family protein